MTLNIAFHQFSASIDPAANLEHIKSVIRETDASTVNLLIFPENSMYSDPKGEQPDVVYSELLDGTFVTQLRDAAKAAGLGIVIGITEYLTDDDRVSNTVLHISTDGRIDGLYRKIHLYDAFGIKESDKVVPADIVPPLVFAVEDLNVGVMTCYDLRFPEMARYVVDAGADVLVIPAAWAAGPAKELHWDTLLRARAIENTVYVVGVGQTGPSCVGQSVVIDPMGTSISSAGEDVVTGYASISADRVRNVRLKNPSLVNRRFAVAPSLTE